MNQELVKEIEFCLKLWDERGHCSFGGHNECEKCAAPYLIYKLLTGEVIHGDVERLTLDDWKDKMENIKRKI